MRHQDKAKAASACKADITTCPLWLRSCTSGSLVLSALKVSKLLPLLHFGDFIQIVPVGVGNRGGLPWPYWPHWCSGRVRSAVSRGEWWRAPGGTNALSLGAAGPWLVLEVYLLLLCSLMSLGV